MNNIKINAQDNHKDLQSKTFKFKQIIKEFLPPVLIKFYRKINHSQPFIDESYFQEGKEQNPDYYDKMFITNENELWSKHYTESYYYPLWTILTDRIMRDGKTFSVLDIGCGPGQLPLLLYDQGLTRYLGFDFSQQAINYAKKMCPKFDFLVADAFQTDLYDVYDYDTVICTEFLEHVENDCKIICKIPSGKHFYGTVPNFSCDSHVRFFKNIEEVKQRYEIYFHSFKVHVHLASTNGIFFFVLEGIKK
ncbi:MAG: class I SAM-dependent methyltransferase [Goleter apudmare HA4340-LM2]|jgi:2-polyprenyl-3-methyl-5-hydroxy-6-metoxy-1,4-benzoquinol methylase|nr:class I SAM-dependent methyltransferase [Goleter apudmare HA4340-LM2]